MPASFQGDRVLGASFRLWWTHLGPVGLLGLAVLSPALLCLALGGEAWLAVALAVPLEGLFRGAVAHAVSGRLRGGAFGTRAAVRATASRSAVVAGTAIVAFLATALAALPAAWAWHGFWPLAIPLALLPAGVACTFAVAIPVAVVEPGGVATALGRSVDLTSGRRFGILVVFLVVGALGAGLSWLLRVVLPGAPGAQFTVDFLVTTLAAVATGVVYHELLGRPSS